MIENKKTARSKKFINKQHRLSALAAGIAIAAGTLSAPVCAENNLSFETDNGWAFGVNGYIPVFATYSDNGNDGADAFRITTGFNPATLQFNVSAPTQNGLDISGHFQLNSHLAGADGKQNSGFGREGFGRVSGVESRVAEMIIAGNFGKLSIGKGYGIFGTPAIGDSGSGMGVGLFGANNGDATAGRIGNGYFYANFNPRVIYSSPRMSGFQVKVGAFQPEKPKDGTAIDNDVVTDTPRVEANLVWTNEMLTFWTSGFVQQVNSDTGLFDDFTMNGIDAGGSLSAGAFGLRANYSVTQGTGNGIVGGHGVVGGSQEESADQWYVEGTFDVNKTTLGASYGEGSDDLTDNDTGLTMLFARYHATDAWTMLAELQDFKSDASGADYQAIIVGSQFTF